MVTLDNISHISRNNEPLSNFIRMGGVLFQMEREERSGKVGKSVISCQTGVAVVEVEQEGRLKLNKPNSMSFVRS